ncbi:MAG: hypothetical protein MHMPM18_004351 [Marteilia pararefringens]
MSKSDKREIDWGNKNQYFFRTVRFKLISSSSPEKKYARATNIIAQGLKNITDCGALSMELQKLRLDSSSHCNHLETAAAAAVGTYRWPYWDEIQESDPGH